MTHVFRPRLPLFFIASNDFIPLATKGAAYEFVLGYTSKEVAELYIVESQATDSLGIMIVEDVPTYVMFLEYLQANNVRHIGWNATVRSTRLRLTTIALELARWNPGYILLPADRPATDHDAPGDATD